MRLALKTNKFLAFFTIMTIIAYQFYGGHFLNQFVIKLSCTILIGFLILFTNKYWICDRKDIPFHKIIRAIFLIMCISMLMTYIFKEQSIPLSFTILSRSAFHILFFFFLWKIKPTQHEIQIYILLFGFLYIVLWSYAIYMLPTITFGETTSNGEFMERGISRINFVGRGNLILAFFLSLNKFKDNNKKIWIFMSILFFIFIILQVTRQLIIWTLIIGVGYIVWNNKKILITSISIIIFLYMLIPNVDISDDSLIGNLLNQTEEQMENQQSGQDDIRIIEYKFYFTEWHDNIVTSLFGTGMPHGASEYGKWCVRNINERMRIFSSDVGYAQMFEMFGLIGLILFILLFFKAALTKVPKSMVYTRLWFFFMIPSNITAAWYIKSDFMILTVICLYLMGQYLIKNKITIQKKLINKNIK